MDYTKLHRLSDQKFPMGSIVITRNANVALEDADIIEAISRHARGDWGNLVEEDIKENEYSLKEGYRLFSSYKASGGTTFWIITEADRSVTTVLLPLDY